MRRWSGRVNSLTASPRYSAGTARRPPDELRIEAAKELIEEAGPSFLEILKAL